jgi:hypothetical protein
MRSRQLLHRTKLEQFAEWCTSKQWEVTRPTANYQVLRVNYGAKHPAIVYDRHEGEHYTVFGNSLKLVARFIHEKKGA